MLNSRYEPVQCFLCGARDHLVWYRRPVSSDPPAVDMTPVCENEAACAVRRDKLNEGKIKLTPQGIAEIEKSLSRGDWCQISIGSWGLVAITDAAGIAPAQQRRELELAVIQRARDLAMVTTAEPHTVTARLIAAVHDLDDSSERRKTKSDERRMYDEAS